jgi:hypothetical protein
VPAYPGIRYLLAPSWSLPGPRRIYLDVCRSSAWADATSWSTGKLQTWLAWWILLTGDLYLTSVVLSAVAVTLLLGPVAYHRVVFRRGLKEALVRFADVTAIR